MNKPFDIFAFTHTLNESKAHVGEEVKKLPEGVFDLRKPEKFLVLLT